MARHALITGAAAGLGAGIARRLAERGYALTLTHRAGEGATAPAAVLDAVRQHDAQALSLPVDFRDRTATRGLIAELKARPPVDVLIHAAGPLVIARFEKASLDEYDAMIEANLTSAVLLAQALLPAMRERGFGRLIFFGMTGSSVTRPARGLGFYGAAKAGLTHFARTLSLEEARHGISVNLIEPGDIRDKARDRAAALAAEARNPAGHAGSWEDVADAALFLAGDDHGFVNGAVVAVGGGLIDAAE